MSTGTAPSRRSIRAAVSVWVCARTELARRRLTAALDRDDVAVERVVAGAEELPAVAGERAAVVVVAVGSSAARRTSVFRYVRRTLPDTHVVVVCPPGSEQGVRRVVESGVDGFVRESDVEAALAPTVLAVAAGQLSVPRHLRHAIGQPALSHREKQTLSLVVIGLTNAEIANRLYLAESTVKSHLSSAFSKLGVRSRYDAVALILDPEERLGPGILAASPDGGSSIALALAVDRRTSPPDRRAP